MPAYRPQAGDEGADMAISAKELPLGKVFTPDFRFTIPSFQRAYIWKTENILQLVSDLDDACKSPGTPYFLGSLILVREGDNRYDVIDGAAAAGIPVDHHRRVARSGARPGPQRNHDARWVSPATKRAASSPSLASRCASATQRSSANTCRKTISNPCSI